MSSPLDSAHVTTPCGDLSIIADGDVVVAAGFAPVETMWGRLSATQRAAGLRELPRLGRITEAVEAYLAGQLTALDEIPVRQPGGTFTQEAWRMMREIPPGQVWTYTELAMKAGRPGAIRAAGTACARNLVAPFVPCHRVVRTDGTLGGYYYGLDVKRWLLAQEGASSVRLGEHRPVDRV